MRKIIAGILFFVFMLTSCGQSSSSNIVSLPLSTNYSSQSTSNSEFTPTPFQSVPPTATAEISLSPTSASIIQLGLERPTGQVNILMLGSDYRPNQGYRTDTLMVLSLNPEKGTASLTSFPRDLYVDIPGMGLSRINAAHSSGGFALSSATFKNNFDVTVDYYIMTTFSGLIAIIDTLGGINVYSGMGLTDKCDLPQAVNKYCNIPAGSNTMNGATALWYVRSRQTGNDFDRTRRAQEVMTAIFQKMISLDALNRGSELYNLFINSVETNLDVSTVLKLLPFASKIAADPSIVKQFIIGSENVTNYTVPETGSMVLLPDPVSIAEIIKQAFY